MSEVKYFKQRTQSKNEEEISPKPLNMMFMQHTSRVAANSCSKRSETSQELWNAQSSYQNGMNSHCSTHSIMRMRSGLISNTNASPRPDQDRDENYFLKSVKKNKNFINTIRSTVMFDND